MNLVVSSAFLSLLEVVATYEPRVVGGSDVKSASKYPYQVSLQNAGDHFCGGSILTKRWILTAAHCMNCGKPVEFKRKVLIMVGSVNRRIGGDTYGIDYAICHPKYDNLTAENDIGMIRVAGTIEFNENVQPIALSMEEFTDFNSSVVFTGWGRGKITKPIILQEIELKVIPYNICKPLVSARLKRFAFKKTNMCTLTKKGEGICMGDSGGPLVADGLQIGLASFGFPCARGVPDVYTKVYAYVDLIDQVMANAKNRHGPHLVIHFCALFSALIALQNFFFIWISF